MSVLFVTKGSSVSEPPFGGLHRVNLCHSSLARWKARSRLPTGYNIANISLALTAEALTSKRTSKSAFIEGGGSI